MYYIKMILNDMHWYWNVDKQNWVNSITGATIFDQHEDAIYESSYANNYGVGRAIVCRKITLDFTKV
jgi:hypothetical protein